MECSNGSNYYYCDIPSDDPAWDVFSDGSTQNCMISNWIYSSKEEGKKFYEDLKEAYFFQLENVITIQYNNGDLCWSCNGKKHRVDGAAVENSDGSKEWWVDGEMLSEEEFNKRFPKE